jgi:hypothetical protein
MPNYRRYGIRFYLSGQIAVAAILAAALGVRASPPQTDKGTFSTYEGHLGEKVTPLNLMHKSFAEALLDISYSYHVPLAFEYVDRQSVTKPLGFVLGHATIRSAFEALIQRQPEYRVSFHGGVVDVFSPKARANTSNLLNRTVPKFDVAGADLGLVGGMLQGTLLNSIGPPRGFGGSFAGVGGPQVAVHARNRRVYQSLQK